MHKLIIAGVVGVVAIVGCVATAVKTLEKDDDIPNYAAMLLEFKEKRNEGRSTN